MNNLEYTHDSLAHDFSMFLPKEQEPAEAPRRKPNIVKMPVRKQAAKKAEARQLAGKISSFLMAGLVLAMLCGSIYLRVEVNEVTNQIGKAQSRKPGCLWKLSGRYPIRISRRPPRSWACRRRSGARWITSPPTRTAGVKW